MAKIEAQKHINFILRNLKSKHDVSIEASSTWIVYWSLSSLRLLGYDNTVFYDKMLKKIEISAEKLFSPNRFYISHLGNVYSSISILYQFNKTRKIEKDKIIDLLINNKNKNGSFNLNENGEKDIRGIYCALAICKMLEINFSGIFTNSKEYILKCQTYEGGFAAMPDAEAHGGYTYCAVASLRILGSLHECNILRLSEWLMARKDENSNGLNGRTNKEPDSCYGFWIGGCIQMLKTEIDLLDDFWVRSVTQFTLERQCNSGGFEDKAENGPDLQHTCYSLFFLAMFDRFYSFSLTVDPILGVVTTKQVVN